MSIKLSDYIKDVENVFTEEEAKMIYERAGFIGLVEKLEEIENHFKNLSEEEFDKKLHDCGYDSIESAFDSGLKLLEVIK